MIPCSLTIVREHICEDLRLNNLLFLGEEKLGDYFPGTLGVVAFAAQVEDQSDQRSGMHRHVERESLVLPSEEVGGENQVR